jgi:ethanolamine ammonia-lyase small subunit
LRRPDLGRQLNEESGHLVSAERGMFDAAFVLADGLSALAVERHGERMLESILTKLNAVEWNLAPVVIVEQGRVAIGDEIADRLGASLVVVLIGERPGLSSPDSLGIYLTWNPRPGVTNADRNCISNIWAEGLSYEAAAHRLFFLMTEARFRKLSGVALREDAGPLAVPPGLSDSD